MFKILRQASSLCIKIKSLRDLNFLRISTLSFTVFNKKIEAQIAKISISIFKNDQNIDTSSGEIKIIDLC